MAARTKVLEISDYIHLVCIKYNNDDYNPYRLYLFYPDKDRCGYPTEHRKELTRYADFQSVICHIKDLFIRNYPCFAVNNIIAWNNAYCGKN